MANTGRIIEDVQTDVVARLKAKILNIAIENFPDHPDSYALGHPVGAILVQYGGSTYGAAQDTEAVVQDRLMQFGLRFVWRSLNGEKGVTAALEATRKALQGFRPRHCKKMRVVRDYFVAQQGGKWEYQLEVAAGSVAVQEMDATNEPLFVAATFLDVSDGEPPLPEEEPT